ncbi:hypothetical protein H8D91_01025 [archaeon]|nr:hypothetical protein [archaeon]
MVTKNKAYKRNIERYGTFLKNLDDDKKDLAVSILEGSYRNGSAKGSRSYEGQRVDTYEGRIKAVTEILGFSEARHYKSLEKLMSTNNYLKNTVSHKKDSEGVYRSEQVKDYISKLSEDVEQPVGIEKSLEGKLEIVPNKKKGSFGKKLALAAGLAIVAGTYLVSGCKAEKITTNVPEPTPIYQEISKDTNAAPAEVIWAEVPKEVTPKIIIAPIKTKEKSVESSNDAGLVKIFSEEPAPAEVVYLIDTNSLEDVSQVIEELSEPVTLEPVTLEPVTLESVVEGKFYRKQVDARNFQSYDAGSDKIDDKVSMNPIHLKNGLGNEFSSWGEDLKDGEKIGYVEGKTAKRLKSLKDALFLGFTKENKEARKKHNFLLRTIMAAYDVPQSLVKGAVALPDLVLGGLTEKVVYDGIGGGVKTLVNSTVHVGNEVFAVPLDASQRFENWAFKNEGKVSMGVYEAASTIMRFGGNVVLHEAPFDGKYIEVRNEKGEKVLINKGENGATLESLMAVLLDAGVLSSGSNGGSDGGFDGGDGGPIGGNSGGFGSGTGGSVGN